MQTLLPGWDVSAEVSESSPYAALLTRAEQWNPDLLVIGSHGRGVIGRMLLGSVSHFVVNHAACSVRIGRATQFVQEAPVQLVIGFDGSEGSLAAIVPSGRFAFAVWGAAAENPWLGIVREVVSHVIDLPAPDLNRPNPFRYSDVSRLLTLLERNGMCELDVSDWRGRLSIGGGLPAAEAANFALAAFSSFSELLDAEGADARSTATKLLNARFREHEQNHTVQLGACVHIVTGLRESY
jgi:hypothetical protein